MSRHRLASLGVLVFLGNLAVAGPPAFIGAQSLPDGSPAPGNSPPSQVWTEGQPNDCADCGPRIPHVWGGLEYLVWWIKDAPIAVPLATSGSPADTVPGALGQRGTTVLLGDSCVGFGEFSGGRINLGGWLDPGGILGVEGTGFLLEQRSKTFTAPSGSDGNPLLAIPFTSPGNGASSVFVTFPDSFMGPPAATGGVAARLTSRLWGAEGNALLGLYRTDCWSVDAIAGFRYLDLSEKLDLYALESANDGVANIAASTADHFGCRNQFYGGQLGLRLGFHWDALFVNTTAKVALGSTHEALDVGGITNFTGSWVNGGAIPASMPGGIFANLSNSGRETRNAFSVVPELEVKVGYAVRPWLRGFVTYNFLYWSRVARPGDQINGNVTGMAGGVPLALWQFVPSAGQSTAIFNSSDFWAQGISLGVEMSW
ncbi:MAG: BBP7 family outer membrane beta-barrel protein [Gemmataceae bacterium]|nr:BBP7 family outer membrane beta-barrel protein [Gemmataceae bacterium]